MDFLAEFDRTDTCDNIKSIDAKWLCKTIRNDSAQYRPNHFWLLKDRKGLKPGGVLRATIGPAFVLAKPKYNIPGAIEKQIDIILYRTIFLGGGGAIGFRPLALSCTPFRCEWPLYTKPIKGWIQGIDAKAWFHKLSRCHKKWKNQRIFEFLKLSTYSLIPFDGALTSALLALWDPVLNCFLLGRGLMTVTLADIAFITGLSPCGVSGKDLPVFKVLPKAESIYNEALELYHKIAKTGLVKCGFQTVVSYFMSEHSRTASKTGEEVLFLTFAFSRLMMPKVGGFTTVFLPLAANIVANEEGPVALGPILLGQLYRCLFRCKEASMTLKDQNNSSLENVFGPLWLITCWGFMHFRSLLILTLDEELKKEINDECHCYGEVAFNRLSTTSVRDVSAVMKSLLDTDCPSFYWSYFNFDKKDVNYSSDLWTKKCLPSWLKSLPMTEFSEKDTRFWNSILYSRDLIAAEPEFFGFEAYNPQLVARQFGLCQSLALPLFLTQNNPWDKRSTYEEMIAYESKTLSIHSQPVTLWGWSENSECITASFSKFWQYYKNDMQDTRSEAHKHFTACVVFRGKKRQYLESDQQTMISHGSKCIDLLTIDDNEDSEERINVPVQNLSLGTKCFFIPKSSLKRGARKSRFFRKVAFVEEEKNPEAAQNDDFNDVTLISQMAKKPKFFVGSGNYLTRKRSEESPLSNFKKKKTSPSNKKRKLEKKVVPSKVNTPTEEVQANTDESVASECLMHLSKSVLKNLEITQAAKNKDLGEQVSSLDVSRTQDATQGVIDLDFSPGQEMLVNGEDLGQVSNGNAVSHQQTLLSDGNPSQIVYGTQQSEQTNEEPNSKLAEVVGFASTEKTTHVSVFLNENSSPEKGGGQDSTPAQTSEILKLPLNDLGNLAQSEPLNTSNLELESLEGITLQSLKNSNYPKNLPARQHILSVVSKLKEDKMDLESSQELADLIDKYLQAGMDEWDPLFYMVRDDIIPLQKQFINLQQHISQHTVNVTQAQAEMASFEQQLLRLEKHRSRVRTLTSELSVVQQLIEELQKQLDEAKHKENLIKDELAALNHQISKEKAENDQKKVQVQKANQLLKDFRKSKGQGAVATRKLDMLVNHIEEECIRLISASS